MSLEAARGQRGSLRGTVAAPPRAFLDTIGSIGVLTERTLRSAVTPPYPYGNELVRQMIFAIRVCWFPMIVASVGFTYGPAGIQAANFLSLAGALDRLGGLFVLLVVREFAPLVCGLIVAGAAGTAICADLGARKIREELDALQVLGVDPIKHLVVPRFLALALVCSMFNIFALAFGTLGGMLVTITHDAPLGPFWATYFNNATIIELAASFIKTALFGGTIAIVCCYQGMTASGGPEGVGRAVNQAVVIAFMGVGIIDYVFTQALLASFNELSVPR